MKKASHSNRMVDFLVVKTILMQHLRYLVTKELHQVYLVALITSRPRAYLVNNRKMLSLLAVYLETPKSKDSPSETRVQTQKM